MLRLETMCVKYLEEGLAHCMPALNVGYDYYNPVWSGLLA